MDGFGLVLIGVAVLAVAAGVVALRRSWRSSDFVVKRSNVIDLRTKEAREAMRDGD